MQSVRPALHALDASTDVPGAPRTSMRTCIGCRETAERTHLLRLVVREVDGRPTVVPDPRRRMPGRGAHLHPDPACLQLAVRRKAFGRAFRAAASVDVDALAAQVAAAAT